MPLERLSTPYRPFQCAGRTGRFVQDERGLTSHSPAVCLTSRSRHVCLSRTNFHPVVRCVPKRQGLRRRLQPSQVSKSNGEDWRRKSLFKGSIEQWYDLLRPSEQFSTPSKSCQQRNARESAVLMEAISMWIGVPDYHGYLV